MNKYLITVFTTDEKTYPNSAALIPTFKVSYSCIDVTNVNWEPEFTSKTIARFLVHANNPIEAVAEALLTDGCDTDSVEVLQW